MDVIVMGRKLGTSDGWDQSDDWTIIFPNFNSNVTELKDSNSLAVFYELGLVEQYDEDGEIIFTSDLVPILNNIPLKM